MNTFKFDKKEPKVLTVEIEGKKFRLNPYTLAVQKATEKFVKCQQPIINELKKNKLAQSELDKLVLKSCYLVRDTVNGILGKNSYERIFAGRTVDFQEHQALITYLLEEITSFCKENPVAQQNEFAA